MAEEAGRARSGLAAVVGAGGFIGSHLVSGLRAAEVPCLRFDRSHPPLVREGLAAGLDRADTVFFLATGLSPALAENRPDLVAHEHETFGRLLEALADLGSRPLTVLASSGGTVYAPDHAPPYAESDRAAPVSAYGRAKFRMEQELLRRADGLRPLVLRLSNVYGPGQRPSRGYGVLPHWLDAAARGDALRVLGGLDVARDYVHVNDVVRALVLSHCAAAEGAADGVPAILNIGSGTPVPLGRLLDTVMQVIGREVAVMQEEARPFDREGHWLEISLARSALGWRPGVGLKEGVQSCWEAVLQAHRSSLREPSPSGPL